MCVGGGGGGLFYKVFKLMKGFFIYTFRFVPKSTH